jgi:uncharacterized tellurite resistance protein B-like protein
MFDQLRALFGNPTAYTTPLPEADARHAMGMLMVRAAKADQRYLFAEIKLIDRVLAARHGLNPVEAAQMRAACEKLEAEMPDTEEVARILRDAVGLAEREATLHALWKVVFADGVKRDVEEQVLHQIEAVLGIPPARAKELQEGAAP